MELTVANVYGLLLRSKLLAPEEARAMFARWQTEAGDSATNLARFAAWMVTNRYLTEYQAALLARGHAEGFFLNDYKILDRLGMGQMAGVYKAQHQLGQVVAIKVLPPSKAREPDLLQRFHREAHLAMKLKHPNIVRIFHRGQAAQDNADPLHYIVMEYLDGETLEDIMGRRKKLPPAEAVRLIYQALQGLQHIHGHGLVHRDLKLANLMVVGGNGAADTTRGTLKIVDLGLGRTLFDAGTANRPGGEGLTSEGTLLGTPDYMSPEQARDPSTVDIRSDIYSLGCVLYHLLAGQIPFPDTNLINLMIRHATETPRPLGVLNPAVPDGLQQIVNWMMAKEPAKRYPTPERAAQALEMFLAAGASESLPNPDAEVKLNRYLTWLEVNNAGNKSAATPPLGVPVVAESAAAKPVPIALPAVPARPAKPSAAVPPSLPVTGSQGHKSGPQRRPERGRKPETSGVEKVNTPTGKLPVVTPKQAPPLPEAKSEPLLVDALPESNAEIDVELHSLSGVDLLGRSPFDLTKLDRRDLVLFGLGVVAGGMAVGMGCWLALRRGSKPPPDAE